MESISFSKTLGYPFPSRLQLRPLLPASVSPNFQPLKPSRKTPWILRASHRRPPPSPKSVEILLPLLKPAVLSLTAAAAVFFSRHSLPSLAAVVPPPPAESETLPSSGEPRNPLLEENVVSDPDEVESLRALVQEKVKQQKIPEAIAVVDRLILLNPGDLDLHILKAHLHTYTGDTERAKGEFEEVLKAKPLAVEAYHGLVMVASRSNDAEELGEIVVRVAEAMKLCQEEKRSAELRDFTLLVAQVRIIEGQYQDALKIYHEMVKEEPRDFRPYLCQGIVYTLLKKGEEADKSFKQYKKLVPKEHPYAQLFESNLSGIDAALEKMASTGIVGSF